MVVLKVVDHNTPPSFERCGLFVSLPLPRTLSSDQTCWVSLSRNSCVSRVLIFYKQLLKCPEAEPESPACPAVVNLSGKTSAQWLMRSLAEEASGWDETEGDVRRGGALKLAFNEREFFCHSENMVEFYRLWGEFTDHRQEAAVGLTPVSSSPRLNQRDRGSVTCSHTGEGRDRETTDCWVFLLNVEEVCFSEEFEKVVFIFHRLWKQLVHVTPWICRVLLSHETHLMMCHKNKREIKTFSVIFSGCCL